jgi:hypothetical protein
MINCNLLRNVEILQYLLCEMWKTKSHSFIVFLHIIDKFKMLNNNTVNALEVSVCEHFLTFSWQNSPLQFCWIPWGYKCFSDKLVHKVPWIIHVFYDGSYMFRQNNAIIREWWCSFLSHFKIWSLVATWWWQCFAETCRSHHKK